MSIHKYTNCSGNRVLVIGNNLIYLRLIYNLLERLRLNVTACRDIIIAKDYCNKHNYNLIILGCDMREQEGMEFLKYIREIYSFRLPVMIMTAKNYAGIREEYIKAGYDECICLPITIGRLKNFVQRFVCIDEDISTNEADKLCDWSMHLQKSIEEQNLEQYIYYAGLVRDYAKRKGNRRWYSCSIEHIIRAKHKDIEWLRKHLLIPDYD